MNLFVIPISRVRESRNESDCWFTIDVQCPVSNGIGRISNPTKESFVTFESPHFHQSQHRHPSVISVKSDHPRSGRTAWRSEFGDFVASDLSAPVPKLARESIRPRGSFRPDMTGNGCVVIYMSMMRNPCLLRLPYRLRPPRRLTVSRHARGLCSQWRRYASIIKAMVLLRRRLKTGPSLSNPTISSELPAFSAFSNVRTEPSSPISMSTSRLCLRLGLALMVSRANRQKRLSKSILVASIFSFLV